MTPLVSLKVTQDIQGNPQGKVRLPIIMPTRQLSATTITSHPILLQFSLLPEQVFAKAATDSGPRSQKVLHTQVSATTQHHINLLANNSTASQTPIKLHRRFNAFLTDKMSDYITFDIGNTAIPILDANEEPFDFTFLNDPGFIGQEAFSDVPGLPMVAEDA